MYTRKKINELFLTINNARLDMPSSLRNAEFDDVRQRCNGIGADWQSEKSRKIFTRILNYAEATALIHDWQYSESDGSPSNQQKADDRFLLNGYREIDFKYPHWWSWRRWYAKASITAAHTLLKRLGVVAWRLSYAEQKLKEEGKI
jgi:hypothetical protein|nr:MAG TPA: hypothetical protein [Caudoviricetes sp.]